MLQFYPEESLDIGKEKKNSFHMKKIDFSRKNMNKMKLNSIAGFKFILLFKLNFNETEVFQNWST